MRARVEEGQVSGYHWGGQGVSFTRFRDAFPLAASMIASLTVVDYSVLAAYLAAMLGMGIYFAGEQKTTSDFFLGGRAFNWFPLGMSLMATLISALTYTGLPGQAYEHGLKCLLIPLSAWLILPVLVAVVLPIYRGLGLSTIYEYLELRFDARVRLAGSLVFIVWRLLWLGGVIDAPCKAVIIASGLNIPEWPLLVGLGVVTTAYTFLGGMKAVIWTDVTQGMAMLGGVVVVIAGVWVGLEGGPQRVTEVAGGLSRLELVDLSFNWKSAWSLWGALPHWMLAHLSFYAADQITAQRFLCARSVNAARTSYVVNCAVLSVLHPALMYIGLCLLAYYYDHPGEMRPEWVVNVDHRTRGPVLGPDGRPLIDPRDPPTPRNIHQLVRQGKILRPNSLEPVASAEGILDPESGAILVEKLAMRRPSRGSIRGEVIVAKGAPEAMLPRFIVEHLPWGAAGLILAALLAACMSSIDSGLNSICTLLVMDIHRRYGVGKRWLARRLGKAPDELSEADELVLARPLTLVIGIAATLFSLLVAQVRDIFDIMVGVANTFGAPLLGVFLLGMFTRRCTAAGALTALVGGAGVTVGLSIYNRLAAAGYVPGQYAPDNVWVVTIGVLATMAVGYASSLMVGRRKTNVELRGLVYGYGEPGVLAADEEVPLIGDLEGASSDDEAGVRWK